MTKNSTLLSKKAAEDEIRKVESERPLEGENQVPEIGKRKAVTQIFQKKWKKSVDLPLASGGIWKKE